MVISPWEVLITACSLSDAVVLMETNSEPALAPAARIHFGNTAMRVEATSSSTRQVSVGSPETRPHDGFVASESVAAFLRISWFPAQALLSVSLHPGASAVDAMG